MPGMVHRKRCTIRVALSGGERRTLRRAGLELSDLARADPEQVCALTGGAIPLSRADHIVASAALQSLGSVGPAIADDLIALGIRRIEDLVGRDPTQLWEDLNRRTGKRHDPCVEDVFRCAVAQAEDPQLPEERRQWWTWTPSRGRR